MTPFTAHMPDKFMTVSLHRVQSAERVYIGLNVIPPMEPLGWNYFSNAGEKFTITQPVWTVPAGTSIAQQLEYAEDIVRRIDKVAAEPCDQDEPPATEHAIATAKDIVRNTAQLRTGYRFRATVICLDGAIRITWASKTRNIRLVCNPNASAESYVYRERLIGRRAVEHSSEAAAARALTKWLAWLNRSI